MSELETLLERQISYIKLPKPQREHRFCERLWRLDFAWPDRKIAVEVEGGTWAGGRHTRGEGFRNDCEKYNRATVLGWRVLRFTGDMIATGEALYTIEEAFKEGNDNGGV